MERKILYKKKMYYLMINTRLFFKKKKKKIYILFNEMKQPMRYLV